MKVRRRQMPLDYTTRSAVKAGNKRDPRIHDKPVAAGGHVPKMRGVNQKLGERPTLYTYDGLDAALVAEERTKTNLERGTIGLVTLYVGESKQKIEVPYERYGREAAKMRAANIAAPWGHAVQPGGVYGKDRPLHAGKRPN